MPKGNIQEKKDLKPLSVLIEETKEEIINSINIISNKNGLSFYYLDIIMEPIYREIKEKSAQEVALQKKNYYEEIKNMEGKSDK